LSWTDPDTIRGERLRDRLTRFGFRVWNRTGSRPVARLYHYDLIYKTQNFRSLEWRGVPIWQNPLDTWTIQQTVFDVQPALLIETGTDHGGSAFFYANLMDLMGAGKVITVDVLNNHEGVDHPRVEFITQNSTDPALISRLTQEAEAADGPVMVILDSDHSYDHVAAELEAYAPLVTPGSYLLSQDGVIDQFWIFRETRPGPLRANREFLERHPEFEYDEERNRRFRLTQHPLGWMRRRETP
jgi:cephalosporin hydroxylase